jgi:hypothetical protein
MINLKLSTIGTEIALMALAFSVGRSASAKALGEVNAERKAAQDAEATGAPAIDRFSDFANTLREQEVEDNARIGNTHTDEALAAASPTNEDYRDSGSDRKVSFVEYCVLFAALNDAIAVMAGPNGKWPRPQSVSGILDYQSKVHARTVNDDTLAGMRAIIEADTEQPCELTDEELLLMAKDANQAQAESLAAMFEANRQDIADRMEAGILNYNRFCETSWETLFNNLPSNIRYSLLGSIGFKLEDKIYELKTGKLRNGDASKGANRPLLVRASEISVLRGDCKVVESEKGKIPRLDPELQSERQLPPSTPIVRKSDGPTADRAIELAASTTAVGQALARALTTA